MTYRIRLSAEVQEWLTALRAEAPEVAHTVGGTVVVLLEDGLDATPIETALYDEDPAVALDHAYQRQLWLMQHARWRVLELSGRKPLEPGPADREEAAPPQEVRAAKEHVDRMRGMVDAFRTRKESAKALYTAERASRELYEELGEPYEDAGLAGTRAVADAMGEAAELERQLGGDVRPLRELRLGGVRLLFAVEEPELAVFLVVGMDADDWAEWYAEALSLAEDELDPAEFTDYDVTAFLAGCFPGEEAVVRAVAERLRPLRRPAL